MDRWVEERKDRRMRKIKEEEKDRNVQLGWKVLE